MLSSTTTLNSRFSTNQLRASKKVSRSSVTVTRALFTKKKQAAPVVEEKPKKTGLFSFTKPQQKAAAPAKQTKTKIISKVDKATEYKKRQGLGGIVSAFDFAEVRSKTDYELLYDAKYGKLQNGKMTPEQYQALRRKVGGTAKDYWKGWVEVKGEYTDKGYVASDKSSTSLPPGFAFLVATVLGLFGALGYVISQTS